MPLVDNEGTFQSPTHRISDLGMIRTEISTLRAYSSFYTGAALTSGGLSSRHLVSRQNGEIVGHNGAPDVLTKSRPPRPVAPREPKGTFEPGDIGLDPCPEVPQLLEYPVAPYHLKDAESPTLGKADIAHPFTFGPREIGSRGKAPVCAHLARHPAKEALLAFKKYLEPLGVRRVSPLDPASQDQPRGAATEKDLVPVGGPSSALLDDIGVALEKGDDLIAGRNLLAEKHTPPGLIDHPIEDRERPLKSLRQISGIDHISSFRALKAVELRDGLQSISPHLTSDLEQIPVGGLPILFLLGVLDLQDPALHPPVVIGEVVGGLGPQRSSLGQIARDQTDAVLEERGIRWMVDVGFNRRRIDANLPSLLHSAGGGIRDDHPMDLLPGLITEGTDVFLERRVRGALPPVEAGKGTEASRVLQMEGKLLVGEIAVVLQNRAADHLLCAHAQAPGLGTLKPHEVPMGKLDDLRVFLQDPRDLQKLFSDLTFGDHMVKRQLIGPFPAHLAPCLRGDCKGIQHLSALLYARKGLKLQLKNMSFNNKFNALDFPDGD